jgi:thioesterase domain-containing protein
LPISALFETATVAGLAELIDRERISTTEWSSLVPLRSGNGAAPLYLVAWAGGEVLPYRDLVESLDADVSVFGLRAPGVDRRTPPLASVEELARYYVGEVRKHQPRGPYRLSGFCFSGLVAYEMARLLMDEGEEIDLLAMLDAYPYRKPERRRRIQVEARLADFKRADAQGRREWAKERVRAQRIRFTNAVYVKYGPRAYAALRERNRQHWFPRRPWNAVLVASNLARLQYVPRPLDVHVEFFRAQQTPHSRPTVWDELALRGVTLRQIVAPGINHERMMREPYVKLLTAELRQALLDD